MRPHARDSQLGFTLLEALVAVALVAAGATAAMRVVRVGVTTVASDAADTEALVLALDALARARLDPPRPGTQATSASGGMTLERRVRPIAGPQLLEVTVRVTPADERAGVELVEIVRAAHD